MLAPAYVTAGQVIAQLTERYPTFPLAVSEQLVAVLTPSDRATIWTSAAYYPGRGWYQGPGEVCLEPFDPDRVPTPPAGC